MEKLWRKGKDKTQAALERLDRLTKDEGLSAVAQTLGVVHGIADDMRVVMGGAPYFRALSQIFVQLPVLLDRNETNKMKRLLFSPPFVPETDGIL
jgi:hypothetical protein